MVKKITNALALLLLVLSTSMICCGLSNAEVRRLVLQRKVQLFEFTHSGRYVRLKDGRRLRWHRIGRADIQKWIQECGKDCDHLKTFLIE